MKKLSKILKLLIAAILLIGCGLTADSQNNTFKITSLQLKQIRLLDNQAKHDSLMLIQKQAEVDTLNKQVFLGKTAVNRLEEENKYNVQINHNLRNKLTNEKNKTVYFEELYKSTKKKVRNRTIIALISSSVNLLFIIKSLD